MQWAPRLVNKTNASRIAAVVAGYIYNLFFAVAGHFFCAGNRGAPGTISDQ
jgi:hypothetical protein